jgi:flagellar basal body-associated protein FliL
MRAIFLILIVAVVALIAAVATGFLDISQTREAKAPAIEAGSGTIRAQAGQTPAFEVQTGSVEVGMREANVAVPKLEVKPDTARVKVPQVQVRPAEEAQGNAH